MARDVRFCTTDDGARIAYCIEGDGPTTIVALPAFNESFALDHLMPVYQQFYGELAQRYRVIRFDWRGQGLSSEGPSRSAAEYGRAGVEDLLAVARAAGTPIAVFASTNSGPTSLTFSIEHAELVHRLVLYGSYSQARDALPDTLLAAIAAMAGADWETATRTIADLNGRRAYPEEAGQLGEWYARSSSAADFIERLRQLDESAAPPPDLANVYVPALVLHRIADPAIPFAAGQKLATGLPDCRFVPLAGEGHLFCLGDYSNIIAAIDEFLGVAPALLHDRAETSPSIAAGSSTAIILFTDIADSTATTERLGDRAFRDAARALEDPLRAAIRDAGGTTIEGKLLGDGLLAVFASAQAAIGAALACDAAARGSELRLHMGVHAGDVIHEANNVFGGAVNVAARICDRSEPGEVLVSQTVRDLARTSAGVGFEDRGEQQFKGIADLVQVYAVRPRPE